MRIIVLAALLAILPFFGLSQSPNKMSPERDLFVGTWILNNRKGSKNYISDNVKWTISVRGDEFSIQKTYVVAKSPYEYELILFADNRGEKNLVPAVKDIPAQTIFSKTKWDKNSLVRRYKTASYPTPMFTTELTEKYSLSKDGSQMTVQSRIITSDFPDPNGQMNMAVKQVFDREK